MKKQLKPLLTSTTALVLACSVLAGCTGSGNEGGNPAASPVGSANPSPSEQTQEGPSWTWDTTPFDMSWYIGVPYYPVWDPENTMTHKVLSEKTGVRNIAVTGTTGGQDKLNAMIASNTLPDVITIPMQEPQVKLMQQAGLVEPLMPLIEQYAPTFKSIIPESMINWNTYSDGNWYSFMGNFKAPEMVEEAGFKYFANFIFTAQPALMEKYGIKPEDFQTQDGMIAALKKVKDAAPTYNGLPVYPFGTSLMNKVTRDVISDYAQQMGYANEDKDGNYVFPEFNPKYKEFAAFLNRMFREGLLRKESLLLSDKEVEQQALNGQFFSYMGVGATANKLFDGAEAANFEYEYVPVGPLASISSDKGEPYFWVGSLSGYTGTFINKKAKNKDRIIRLLEYLYSDEGQILNTFGVEGETYEKVDGKLKLKDEYLEANKSNPDGAKKTYGLKTLFMVRDMVREQAFTYKDDPTRKQQMTDEVTDVWTNGAKGNYFIGDAGIITNIRPAAGTAEATALSKIEIYLEEQAVKMVTAASEAEFEKLFADTQNRLKTMDYDAVYKVLNDNFQQNKAKLKIDFVYPPNNK